MDSIEELSTSMTNTVKNTSFTEHVLRFDDATKNEIMNVVQYAVLAIVPIVIINKITQNYVPESDETKSTLEIGIEIILQIVFLFVGMFFVHRLITFVPTFSKVDYSEFNILNIILGFMMIVLSLQTKLGLKVEILSDRLMEYIGIEQSSQEQVNVNKGKSSVSVTQPIVHNGGGVPQMPSVSHQPSRADNLDNHQNMPSATSAIDQLPNQNMHMSVQQPVAPQQPNFDSMYQEPFAANDGFGGVGGSFAPF